MNERIRGLGREATIWCVSQPDQEDFDAMWEEKFAELIVRECAYIVENSPWRLKRGYKAIDQAILVKQHFGVEEQEKVVSKPRCSVCGTTKNVTYMGGYQPYLCDSEDCIPY